MVSVMQVSSQVVVFEGRVSRVEKSLIPKIYVVRVEDEKGEYVVEMDAHEDVLVPKEGEKVLFRVERNLGSYEEGRDFVGRATVASIKREDNGYAYLLSIGGLLVVIHSKHELDLVPTEKVYVVLQLKSTS
jgi:hypothetical protein